MLDPIFLDKLRTNVELRETRFVFLRIYGPVNLTPHQLRRIIIQFGIRSKDVGFCGILGRDQTLHICINVRQIQYLKQKILEANIDWSIKVHRPSNMSVDFVYSLCTEFLARKNYNYPAKILAQKYVVAYTNDHMRREVLHQFFYFEHLSGTEIN